jgi:hypothetical protein
MHTKLGYGFQGHEWVTYSPALSAMELVWELCPGLFSLNLWTHQRHIIYLICEMMMMMFSTLKHHLWLWSLSSKLITEFNLDLNIVETCFLLGRCNDGVDTESNFSSYKLPRWFDTRWRQFAECTEELSAPRASITNCLHRLLSELWNSPGWPCFWD